MSCLSYEPTCAHQKTWILRLPDKESSKCSRVFDLGPSDWIMPCAATISILLFYDIPVGSVPEDFMGATRLCAALERLLPSYPILCGSPVPVDRGTYRIELRGGIGQKGVCFTSYTVDTKLDSLPLGVDQYTSTQALHPSLQLVPPTDYNAPLSMPLFAAQHTRFSCGGVCLGIRLSHMIGDMESLHFLLHDWSELYRRGTSWPTQAPSMNRSQTTLSALEVRRAAGTNSDSYCVLTAFPTPAQPATKPISRVFRYTGAQIKRIKDEANGIDKGLGTGQHGPVLWITTFEALAAHFFRLICAVRRHNVARDSINNLESPISSVRLSIATNWRSRLQSPPVPRKLFANTVLLSTIRFDPAQVVSQPLCTVAKEVHTALQECKREGTIRGTLAWIAAQQDRSAISPLFDLSQDVAFSSWNKFGLSSLAFESGQTPTRVCLPHFQGIDGGVMIFDTPLHGRAKGDEGSLDICIGLTEADMARFESSIDFQKFRS